MRTDALEGGTAFCHVSVAPLSPNIEVTKGGRGRRAKLKDYAYLVFGYTSVFDNV